MIHIEDHHLGRTACLPSRLDDTCKRVKAAHEAEWARSLAAAGEELHRATNRRQVSTGPRAPLEEHSLSLGKGQDGIQRIIDRIDKAGRALRIPVARRFKFHTSAWSIPVPAL